MGVLVKLLRSLGVNATSRVRAPGRERMVADFCYGVLSGTFSPLSIESRKTGVLRRNRVRSGAKRAPIAYRSRMFSRLCVLIEAGAVR